MSFKRPSVFTPFLRRFTDERAYDLAETRRLYDRVSTAQQASVWAHSRALEKLSDLVATEVGELVELPHYVPLCEAFDNCQKELLTLETTIFSSIEVDFSRPLSMKDQVDLNRHMRAVEYFLSHEDRIAELLVKTLTNLSAGIMQSVPKLSSSSFSVPLITLIPDPNDMVDKIIGTVSDTELSDVGLFADVQYQIHVNMCEYSKVPLDGSSKRPLIKANQSDLPPQALVETYFAHTPFHELLLTPVPFSLPEEQRFAGHWIIAPSGTGKTTLLHSMVMDDLQKDASIILMDSKGDLITPILQLKGIADRLIIIDPDPENAIAFNPLDIPGTDVRRAVNFLEYIFGALLEFKMTATQLTLFRSVFRALVSVFPNPTLETFRDILSNGHAKYAEHIKKLPAELQDFFNKEFGDKLYVERRKEVLQRIRLLLENDAMRAMLTATQTRFNLSEAMDQGKIIIIINSKAALDEQGAEFFGRFFIAQLLVAAQQRSNRREEDKKPCYCYIDECHNVIKRDEKISTILDECRSQKIALILAHQRTVQITAPNVLDALCNCAIRYANSDDEATFLAPKLRATTAFLHSLKRGRFAAYVRDVTSQAISLDVTRTNFSKYPKLTSAEMSALRRRMKAQYGPLPRLEQQAEPPQEPVAVVEPEQGRKVDMPLPETPRLQKPPTDTPADRGEAGEPSSDWA